jgi:hypothetical protein
VVFQLELHCLTLADVREIVLGGNDQVKAQFGSISNELQGLGLKKKTEYDKPAKKIPTP